MKDVRHSFSFFIFLSHCSFVIPNQHLRPPRSSGKFGHRAARHYQNYVCMKLSARHEILVLSNSGRHHPRDSGHHSINKEYLVVHGGTFIVQNYYNMQICFPYLASTPHNTWYIFIK